MNDQAIAIVGMSAVFPGASDLRTYWANNVAGIDAIGPIPPGRMNGGYNQQLPAEHEAYLNCVRGGFLPENFRFDPLTFGVLPKSVKLGDPDQFLALHVVANALQDAQVAEDANTRRTCDVIIGRGGYMSIKMSEIYVRVDGIERLMQFMGRRYPDMSRSELADLEQSLRATLPESDVDSLSTCMPNIVASRVANRLNLRGAAYTVDAACASSLLAVEQAVRRLRGGQCSLAVAAGLHLCQAPAFWHVFIQLGALSPSSQIRPFHRNADGLLPGEGAGAIVLKRLEDAIKDDDKIYAVIRGVGVASDGRETAVLAPSSAGQIQAVQTAYEDAQIDPATVGYLEAHGTATTAGDATELDTIKAVFGGRGAYPPKRALGSVKSMIGHTMPAAGIASMIRTAMALSSRILPPSLHCEDPHPSLADTDFFVNDTARPWVHGPTAGPRRAGVNAFGFGGINAHVVLEEVPTGNAGPMGCPVPRQALQYVPRAGEVLMFSAGSPTAMCEQLTQVLNFAKTDVTEFSLLDLAASLSEELDFSQPCKLAIVARDLSHAQTNMELSLQRLQAAEAERMQGDDKSIASSTVDTLATKHTGPDFADREEIFYAAHAEKPLGKIACVFPGVGFPGLIGNYPDHLMQLCLNFPEIRHEFDRIELRDEHPDDPTPTSIIFWPPASFGDDQRGALRKRIAAMTVSEPGTPEDPPPSERNIAASGVTLTNWISWVLLEQLGVPADMLCGQSQGEMAALAAANVFSIDEVIPKFWGAMAIKPTYSGMGRLAFAGATEEALTPFLADLEDVSIAIHVSPGTQVLGGSDEHLTILVDRLRKEGIMAQGLPYPPIHTPQLGYLRDELIPIIGDDIEFKVATRAVYSAITEKPFPSGADAIRDLALKNLDHPVRFWQTIHSMYADGARIFVQAGGGTLASNMQTILDKPDIVGAAVDLDHKDSILQLGSMCATLLVSGVQFKPDFLFRHTGFKKLDLSTPQSSSIEKPGAVPLHMDWIAFEADGDKTATESVSGSIPGLKSSTETATEEHTNSDSVELPPKADTSVQTETSAPASEPMSEQALPPEMAEQPQPETGFHGQNPPGSMPLVGEVLEHIPGERIVTERTLHLDEDLFLHDHAFLDDGGVRSIEGCLPVLPLTFVMEVLAETSICLAPGYGVIGLEKVRASRWIAMKNCRSAHLRVEAKLESVDEQTGVCRVKAEVFCDGESSGAATVLLGTSYQQDVHINLHTGTQPTTWPFELADIYRERHLFHGPELQCVSNFGRIDEEGMTGELTILPTSGLFASNPTPQLLLDPVILDGCAQLMGLWALANEFYVLPHGINKLELYRQTPPAGTRCEVHVQIAKCDRENRTVIVDVEVLDDTGAVWLRIQGWREWVFDYYPVLLHGQRVPRQICISTDIDSPDLPAGTFCSGMRREVLRHANIEWLARLMLHPVEMPVFEELPNIRRQWDWLMGRITAKDAARRWIAAQEGSSEMIHPAQLVVAATELGQPVLQCVIPDVTLPAISIAHKDQLAYAVASALPIGVDIEPVAGPAGGILDTFATPAEVELLESFIREQPDADWPSRLWCAKEAVGKALGTGLAGRPTDFEAIDAGADGRILIHYRPNGSRLIVQTLQNDGSIVAVSSLADAT